MCFSFISVSTKITSTFLSGCIYKHVRLYLLSTLEEIGHSVVSDSCLEVTAKAIPASVDRDWVTVRWYPEVFTPHTHLTALEREPYTLDLDQCSNV